MVELAEIFRKYGPIYIQRFGDRILPAHRRAIRDIALCRTEAFGGHVEKCCDCGHEHFFYHSCCSRNCPKCSGSKTKKWLERRKKGLLPVTYFHVVFTIPEPLRYVVRKSPNELLGILFKAAAYSLMKLAADPHYVGGKVGFISVLHTWTRTMVYHPHVHCLVPGGALSPDHSEWLPSRKKYLVPVHALSKIFRARFIKLLKGIMPIEQLPSSIWKDRWVVYSKPCFNGAGKVLDYLGRYVHRIAISNYRILSEKNGHVTFKYTHSKTYRTKKMTLDAMEFIRRFLQHVLSGGFHKVRYYGLLHPANSINLMRVKWFLKSKLSDEYEIKSGILKSKEYRVCPVCKKGHMIEILKIPRNLMLLNERAPP
ncbi:MAG: IS91 family transposase [Candidatus Aminicenantes bacterium]|nr:IS91 family transposase [Candidatus Aminicenantes bacterium]